MAWMLVFLVVGLMRFGAPWLAARPAWQRLEQALARSVPSPRAARGFSSANDLSSLGSAPVVTLASGAGVLLALGQQRLDAALALALAGWLPGSLGGWLKHRLALERPLLTEGAQFAPPITFGSSFPSNHTLMATAFWPVAAACVAPVLAPPAVLLLALGLGLLLLVVGATRLLLRAHHLLDVLGGWLLGGCWAFACTRFLSA